MSTNTEEQVPKFERLPNGLAKGIKYVYDEQGRIFWRQMIPSKYLYIVSNDPKKVAEIENKYGKSIKELKVTEVEDKYLAILLGGIRYLWALRGFKSDKRKVDSVFYDPRYELTTACTVTSEITWIPNEESNYESTSSDIAGATIGNVDDFMKKYIETVASNRAFIRNVRGFLNIAIVGKDELAPAGEVKKPEETENIAASNEPSNLLEKKVKQLKLTFKQFKADCINHYKADIKDNPESWESFKDIGGVDSFTILGKIAKKEEEEKGENKT